MTGPGKKSPPPTWLYESEGGRRKESRIHLPNRKTASAMPQTVPTSATPPPSKSTAARARTPIHPFCFLWSLAKKLTRCAFKFYKFMVRRKTERGREAEKGGSVVEHKSNGGGGRWSVPWDFEEKKGRS